MRVLFVAVAVVFMGCSGGGGGVVVNTLFPTQEVIAAPWTQTAMVDDGTGNMVEAVSRHVVAEFADGADAADFGALRSLVEGRGSSIIGQVPDLGLVQLLALSDADIPVLIQLLLQQGYIERAYPNQVSEPAGETSANPAVFMGSSAWVDATHVEAAWDITTGDPNVIAAVVERRVDFTNAQFAANTTTTVGQANAPTTNHALAVAAVLGAHGNDVQQNGANGNANVAGVAWDCTLMSSPTVGPATGRTAVFSISAAITLAIANGARVVNLSLGPANPTPQGCRLWRSRFIQAARYAANNDALLVFAAANAAIQDDSVLVAGASAADVAVFASNVLIVSTPGAATGNAIDLVAPTQGIAVVNATVITTTQAGATSYAAPQVTGAAALCMSASTGISAPDVKTALTATATNKMLSVAGAVCAVLPLRRCLLPLGDLADGTRCTFDVTQTVTFFGEEVREYERTFELSRLVDPNGPLIHVIDLVTGEAGTHDEFKSDATQLGLRYVANGLELMYVDRVLLANTTFSLGPFSVTVVSPGLLIAPESLRMGDSFSTNVVNLVTLFEGEWVGPSPRPNYPNAHEFTLSTNAVYDEDIDDSDAFPSNVERVLVSGTVYLAPWVGPVEGSICREDLGSGGALIKRSLYEFTKAE